MLHYKLFNHYQIMEDQHIILAFSGSISDKILIGMAEKIKATLSDKDEKRTTIQKIFSVFIELAQNIYMYSTDKSGRGIIVVEEHKDFYRIVSGNLIADSEISKIRAKISHINTLDRKALRKFYYKQLKSPRREGKVGGGVGLIGIAKDAGNPIGLIVDTLENDLSFIEISVKIGKDADNELSCINESPGYRKPNVIANCYSTTENRITECRQMLTESQNTNPSEDRVTNFGSPPEDGIPICRKSGAANHLKAGLRDVIERLRPVINRLRAEIRTWNPESDKSDHRDKKGGL